MPAPLRDTRPVRLCGLALAIATAAAASVASAEPLAIRNQNPLLRGAYLPQPAQSLPANGWQLATAFHWSNTVNAGRDADEFLLVDAESFTLDVALLYRAGDWRFRAALPATWRGAGTLDGFIDGWHDVFGLPDGNRPQVPRDSYSIVYERTGFAPISVESGSSLGDLQLEAGRTLLADERGELVGWVGVELPTGSRARLTSNGAVDVAAWLAGYRRFGERFTLTAQAGAVYLGGEAALPLQDAAGFGTLAAGWRLTPSFEALLQLDAHTALAARTDLDFLKPAALLTLGGRLRFASGAALEAGVTEDIAVDRSPDVVFYVGFRWAPAAAR
jgi:hypothetical protein